MHRCPEHNGIEVPLQEADRHGIVGLANHVETVERGDYIGDEQLQHGSVMAVHSKRPDGSHDTVVFAPTSTGRATEER